VLLKLNTHLTDTLESFKQQLPSTEGLVIRPEAVSRARKTKKIYKHIQASGLKTIKRKKAKNWKYQNGVGARVDRHRSVSSD